jgi:hypothetical protein
LTDPNTRAVPFIRPLVGWLVQHRTSIFAVDMDIWCGVFLVVFVARELYSWNTNMLQLTVQFYETSSQKKVHETKRIMHKYCSFLRQKSFLRIRRQKRRPNPNKKQVMKRLINSPDFLAASEVNPERERRHGLGGWVAMGSPRFDRFKCTRSSQDSSDQFPSCALFQLLVLELGSQSQHFNSDLSLSAQQQQPRKRIDLWFTNRLVEIRAPEACLSPRRARNWF